jgi:hypothetical protein
MSMSDFIVGRVTMRPRARTISVGVGSTTTGLLATASTFGLLAPVAFAKTGGSANLSINSSTGGISATSGLGAGVVQSLEGTATGVDGCVIPFTYTLTGVASVVAPAAPSVTLIAGDGQVIIAWTDGSNGGAAITAHRIYVDGTGLSPITSASPYVLTGLANDVAVSIEVSAINSAGEGSRSLSQNVTPVAPDGPISGALVRETDGTVTVYSLGVASTPSLERLNNSTVMVGA